ncbi:MAG: WG repeat-containing protein, partial [Eggerthellaceae bacterium]|nr:WG repeat-containing protein [Eggerthellaceae bacterium]
MEGEEMFCPVCGNEMPDDARFCSACGATTEPPSVMTPQSFDSAQSFGATPMPTPGVGMDTAVMEIPLDQAQAANQTPVAQQAAPAAKLNNRNKGLLIGLGSALVIALIAIAVVSFAGTAGAVQINEDEFPDPVFRAYVSENVDKNGDGKLSDDELDSVTTMDISHYARDNAKVSDLTGIGHFRGLRTLNASHCNLHRMPPHFDRLHELRVVDVSYNYIHETINVTENYNLIVIYVGGNEEGTTIQAPEETNVIVDPDKGMENDPELPDYVGPGGQTPTEDEMNPEQPNSGENTGENSENGTGENADQGGQATTGGDENEDEASDENANPENNQNAEGEGEGGQTAEGQEDDTSDEGKQDDADNAGTAKAPASNSSTLFAYQSGGKWGYMDEAGTVVIEPAYSDAGAYSEGIAAVKDGSDTTFVNNTGAAVNDKKVGAALPYSEGIAYVVNGGASVNSPILEGDGTFVKADGSELAVSGLKGGGEFHGGYAPAKTANGWGFIDTSGNWSVQPGYDQVTNASQVGDSVIAGVCKSGTWTYIDVRSGAQAFEGEFTEATAFDSTGHAIAKHKAPSSSSSQAAGDVANMPTASTALYKPDDAGMVLVVDDLDGDVDDEGADGADGSNGNDAAADAKNQADEQAAAEEAERQAQEAAEAQRRADEEAAAQAAAEEEERLRAEEEERQRAEEEERQRAEEEERQKQEEEAAAAELAKKYVVIDATGADVAVIEDYETVSPLYEGYAAVKASDGTWGFISQNGSTAISCKFKEVGHFDGGYAPAQDSSGKWGIINTSGEWKV